MSNAQLALARINSARAYTLTLLEDLNEDDWFFVPSQVQTHIAWQVGHLAMAEYRVALERVRGPQPEDREMIPKEFLRQFGKGTTPEVDRSVYPTPDEIRNTLDRVHVKLQHDIPECSDALLDEQFSVPHPAFSTKLGALYFVAEHEMLHAGQIGLIRRMMGKEPLR